MDNAKINSAVNQIQNRINDSIASALNQGKSMSDVTNQKNGFRNFGAFQMKNLGSVGSYATFDEDSDNYEVGA